MFHKTQNRRHVIGLKYIGLINIDFPFNIKLVEKENGSRARVEKISKGN